MRHIPLLRRTRPGTCWGVGEANHSKQGTQHSVAALNTHCSAELQQQPASWMAMQLSLVGQVGSVALGTPLAIARRTLR